MRSYMPIVPILFLVLATLSCEEEKRSFRVSGTIKRANKPLVADKTGGHLLVVFVPENRQADKKTYRAETDQSTGAYRIDAIPPGTYLVAVQQFDERHNDALGHKYDPAKSSLRATVTSDGQVIDVDVPE